ncbi:sterigmatocystin biosynthesis-like protein [Colletotrichum sojae]|uniref:Sterigmatocystin biosynthesis-like protein n=1 Tax=Colletotrichum sojae TaxID=2175907 RepID=A0A8H6N114_9PEZI|nr:sterigmatocystin biosynthesis-like protein [Colletotrichum sojae]
MSETTRTIAMFGATGHTGRETLKNLLAKKQFQTLRIRLYVRSPQKLLALFPDLKSRSNVEVVEGQVTDVERVRSFLSGADTIIATLGENDNRPDVNVLTGFSRTVVAALKQLRNEDEDWKAPWVIQLSSSTWNEKVEAKQPAVLCWLIKHAFYYPYADLVRAHNTFQRGEEDGALRLLLVQPGLLVEEEASGHVISVDDIGMAVSYADLGAGFADVVMEERYRDIKALGVTSKQALQPEGRFMRYGTTALYRMTFGLLATFIPGFWRVNNALGVFS